MTYYEICLNDILHNYHTVSERTGALVVPMLKADAYGMGAAEVANLLIEEGVHAIAVSRLEEALELKDRGIRIWVLSCYHSPEDIEILLDHDFVLAADSVKQCEMISELAGKKNKTATVHLAADTGFGRFGFRPNRIEDIVKVCGLPNIRFQGIFSHLGAAFFMKDKFADKQLEAFVHLVEELKERNVCFSVAHIANSSALVRGKEYHLDAVRIGSALCGRMPVPTDLPLKRVGKLYSSIIDIRTLGKGHNVGYGKTCTLKRSTRVAVVAAGSTDGIQLTKDYDTFRFRDICRYGLRVVKMLFKKDNRMKVLIGGKPAPVLGRVALTHMMVDVTDIECKVGDMAEIPISPLYVARHIPRKYV